MQSQKPTNPDPVYKESEILSDLGQSWVRNHPVNPGKAQAQQTCLTDKVGINAGQAVHFVRLEPGKHSTAVHYHISCSEWMYILRGSATVQLVDASLPTSGFMQWNDVLSTQPVLSVEPKMQERQVGPGDFIGFPAGVGAAKWGHNLVAGEEGCEYLLGGERVKTDVAVYPLAGKIIAFDVNAGGFMCLGQDDHKVEVVQKAAQAEA